MREMFVQRVYDSVNGLLLEECCVPGVENLFAPENDCDVLYDKMAEARQRLCERTGLDEDDADLEQIIGMLLRISRTVGYKMFEYGILLGDQ